MSPLPQCCTLPAHEKATLRLSLSPSLWPSPLRSPLPSPSPLPALLPLSLLLPITVAIGHCRWGCHQPFPPPSLLCCHQPSLSPLPSPSPSAIAVSVTIGQRSCHLCQPSPPLSPLAISECCCLGAARIVFDQLKQRCLSYFIFVWTVGSTLIKAG